MNLAFVTHSFRIIIVVQIFHKLTHIYLLKKKPLPTNLFKGQFLVLGGVSSIQVLCTTRFLENFDIVTATLSELAIFNYFEPGDL